MPEGCAAFFRKIRDHAIEVGFKGTVLVAENADMYGETFRNLALVFSCSAVDPLVVWKSLSKMVD